MMWTQSINLYTNLLMPDQEAATGVLSGLGKATIDVLHEDVHLCRVQRLHRLLHLRGTDPRQDVQNNVEVTLLGTAGTKIR